ncbi:MAG: preprotein translocase subunit SecE [Fimbriimonadaceae bacterium]|nr:preprotein translocase subunit SecE [Fimbriimonadaceae bacterium]
MSKAPAPAKERPTQTRRSATRFLHEVYLELQKVKWPSRQDVVQLTSVVLLTIVMVGLYIFVLEQVFGRLFQWIGMYGSGGSGG